MRLFIDQDLFDPCQEPEDSPFPVWKLYAVVDGKLYEHPRKGWILRSEAQAQAEAIADGITEEIVLKDWVYVKEMAS